MDWDRIEGGWKEYKGKIKTQWGKLTDDDLDVVNGRREELEGRLQKNYGYAKDKARAEPPPPQSGSGGFEGQKHGTGVPRGQPSAARPARCGAQERLFHQPGPDVPAAR